VWGPGVRVPSTPPCKTPVQPGHYSEDCRSVRVGDFALAAPWLRGLCTQAVHVCCQPRRSRSKRSAPACVSAVPASVKRPRAPGACRCGPGYTDSVSVDAISANHCPTATIIVHGWLFVRCPNRPTARHRGGCPRFLPPPLQPTSRPSS